jgi:hypothetical protein
VYPVLGQEPYVSSNLILPVFEGNQLKYSLSLNVVSIKKKLIFQVTTNVSHLILAK